MPTTKQILTDSWTLLAEEAEEFLVENISSYPAQLTFQTSAPASDAAYHVLRPGEAITRLSLTGNLYARDFSGDVGTSVVVVSK